MQPTDRRMFPGGLRAQFLLALCLLLAGIFALVGIAVESVMARRLTEIHERQTVVAARSLLEHSRTESASKIDDDLAEIAGLDWARMSDDSFESVPAEARAAARKLSAETRTHTITNVDGSPVVVAVLPHTEGGRWVVASRSMEGLDDRLNRTREFLWPVFLVVALFILAFGYAFFTYWIMRPLRAIGVATQRASEGDLASPISVLPSNEFGVVGRSFNKMLARLEDNRVELEKRLEALQWANRELKQTQESLIRSEKLASTGELAAGIAHEVGNPLAALSGYNDVLRDEDLDRELVEDILDRSAQQLDRIRTIIRNLLDFSRREEGDPEPTDLAAAMREAVELVSALPDSRSVRFDVQSDGDLPAVRAVPGQVVQVLVNLMMNAVDAMDEEAEEGYVTLAASLREDERMVELRVSDTGSGIPEETRTRIFDPFFTTKEPGEGTGLGLAISLRIMESVEGDIEVESEPGEGTTFRLLFRRWDSPQASNDEH